VQHTIHWFSIDPEIIVIHGLYAVVGDDFLKALRERVHSVTGNKEVIFGKRSFYGADSGGTQHDKGN
jgi:hypothetical protein